MKSKTTTMNPMQIAYGYSKTRTEGGFTIVELSIATAVFSIVLLVSLAGFFQIGRLFYKGVTLTQTQETARQIANDISGSFGPHAVISYTEGGVNGYQYYCIGNTRYTYHPGFELNLDDPRDYSPPKEDGTGGNFGILKEDYFNGDNSCDQPCQNRGDDHCVTGQTGKVIKDPTEMLGQKMRLVELKFSPVLGANYFNLSLVTAYGDDDVLDNQADADTITCKSDSRTQQFCSVARVESSIFKGRI